MMLVQIIIPIYKETLTREEANSFKQCIRVLNNYPIVIVTNVRLNADSYISILIKEKVDYSFEYFDESYFKSVAAYSCLLLSRDFYIRFQKSEYIFIYQLDAFVFKDELNYWCDKGYDYIGAPWFKNYGFYEKGNKLWKVGNGGVSLRKVSSFINIYDKKMPFSTYTFFLKNLRKTGIFKILKLFFSLFFSKKTVEFYLKNYVDKRINEDCFWVDALSNTEIALTVPNTLEAAKFCIEKSPSYLYDLIGNKLPFACHAYEKYEYNTFWKEKILYLCSLKRSKYV